MFRAVLNGAVLIGAVLIAPSLVHAATFNVVTSGTDSPGCGGAGSPCQSVAFALGEATGPGDLILISTEVHALVTELVVSKSGSPSSPLTIRGVGPGAVLNGAALGSRENALRVAGDHVVVEGLGLTASDGAPVEVTGGNVTLRGLEVFAPTGNTADCVLLSMASATTLEDLRVHDCPANGIYVNAGSGVAIFGAEIWAIGESAIESKNNDITLSGVRAYDLGQSSASSAGLMMIQCSQVTLQARPGSSFPINQIDSATSTAILFVDVVSASVENSHLMGTRAGIEVLNEHATGSLELTVQHATITGATSNAAITDFTDIAVISVVDSVLAFNPGGDLPTALTGLSHSDNLRYQNGAGNVALGSGELEADPLFADLASGDAHLRSEHGRFDPSSGWVNDAQTSPAIDLAAPASPFDREPGPNGGRANAGAFGNTAQASMSSAGTPTDAAMPDLALPDALLPDTLLPDVLLPDLGAPDAALPDLATIDSGAPDTALPDGALVDASATDTLGTDSDAPDAGHLDVPAGQDLSTGQDIAVDQDGAGVDGAVADATDGEQRVAVIARAGSDLEIQVPESVVLDGGGSHVPDGATFTWTIADGPQGAVAAPIGDRVITSFRVEQPGIWVFQLTVSAGGVSDSDQVVVTAVATGETAVEGCGCSGSGWRGSHTGLLLLGLGQLAVVLRRRLHTRRDRRGID